MSEIASFQNVYPSKIILFGEYSVLLGGSALACPIKNFVSFWKQGRVDLSDDLFNHFLTVTNKHPQLKFDIDQWKKIKEQNYYLESDIPQGYGLGSSGNYIAALVDQCILFDKTTTQNQVKGILGELENFYHGSSSGLDPFVIYFRKPTHIKNGSASLIEETIDLNQYALYDSKVKRSTQALIKLFNEKYAESKFRSGMEELKNLNDQIIDLSLRQSSVRELYKKISKLQLEIMPLWIPESIQRFWKIGLKNDQYYFKICGAGGGGFFMVYQENSVSDEIKDALIPVTTI